MFKTGEDFDALKDSLQNVAKDVNELIEKGVITVDSREGCWTGVLSWWRLQGIPYLTWSSWFMNDFKPYHMNQKHVHTFSQFLLLACGMKAANSSHSCIWCKVDNTERSDMSKSSSYFSSPKMRRELGEDWRKQPGCKHSPIFNIKPDHIAWMNCTCS